MKNIVINCVWLVLLSTGERKFVRSVFSGPSLFRRGTKNLQHEKKINKKIILGEPKRF